MQIQFENQYINAYQNLCSQTKRTQLGMEAVVPDVNDDIGRIISVQSSVLLKSKEAYSKRICISGEVHAVLLYITEGDEKVSGVRLSKPFDLEYENEEFSPDTLAQIDLTILNNEARILNPRKVAVTTELAGELNAYRQDKALVKTALAKDPPDGLHVKEDSAKAFFADLVTEKTFAVTEQFAFDSNQATPQQLLSQWVNLTCTETQQVGSRLILKGIADIQVWYLTDGNVYPMKARFREPFSQILDASDTVYEYSRTLLTLTSSYYDLVDTISGDKALEMELHVLAQTTGYRAEIVEYISDVYSNRAPVDYEACDRTLINDMHAFSKYINSSEMLPFVDDCAEIYTVFSQITQVSCISGALSATVPLEILYATKTGALATVRRVLLLSKELTKPADRILQVEIKDLDIRQNEENVEVRISIELLLENNTEKQISMITSVDLELEDAFDVAAYPTFTLVRTDEESLWELAKQYHSSIMAIEEMNETAGQQQGRILLIPKQI